MLTLISFAWTRWTVGSVRIGPQPYHRLRPLDFAHPAIPAAEELLAGLCTAAGLCLAHAELELSGQIGVLQMQAAVVQSAVARSRAFWRGMLNDLPAACRLPLSMMCRWRCRIHASTKGSGCVRVKRPGNRGLPTWQRRLLVPLPPLVAPRPCWRAHAALHLLRLLCQ